MLHEYLFYFSAKSPKGCGEKRRESVFAMPAEQRLRQAFQLGRGLDRNARGSLFRHAGKITTPTGFSAWAWSGSESSRESVLNICLFSTLDKLYLIRYNYF